MSLNDLIPTIKRLFLYDNGYLYWRESRGRARAGSLAGNGNGAGYWQVGVNGRHFVLHRVIWAMPFGPIPEGMEIDHIDRDKSNNRIENLRCVSASCNQHNGRSDAVNRTGYRGVSKLGSRYYAYIRFEGKTKNLGYFNTPQEAAEAYNTFARAYLGDTAFQNKI